MTGQCRVLVMGLPGSGKTTLAKELYSRIHASYWINADKVRKRHGDWDFSWTGRVRQAIRIVALALCSGSSVVIADFVAALDVQREIYDPDIVIWMNTIKTGRFENTNEAFMPPDKYDFRFDSFEEVDIEGVIAVVERISHD